VKNNRGRDKEGRRGRARDRERDKGRKREKEIERETDTCLGVCKRESSYIPIAEN